MAPCREGEVNRALMNTSYGMYPWWLYPYLTKMAAAAACVTPPGRTSFVTFPFTVLVKTSGCRLTQAKVESNFFGTLAFSRASNLPLPPTDFFGEILGDSDASGSSPVCTGNSPESATLLLLNVAPASALFTVIDSNAAAAPPAAALAASPPPLPDPHTVVAQVKLGSKH